MITNKKNAFQHNTCKKLVQLGKIISAMNSMVEDQIDKKKSLESQFENLLEELMETHQEKFMNILNSLFKYRKHCINKSCSLFGSYYKNLKKDFIEFFNSQNNKYIQILKEIKEIEDEIKLYQSEEIQKLSSFFENSERFIKFLKNLENEGLKPNSLKDAINPIVKKVDDYSIEWKLRIKKIKEENEANKRELENEMKIQTNNEIQKFAPVWKNFYCLLESLLSEISEYKNSYDSIVKNHSQFFMIQYNVRNKIVDDTNHILAAFNERKKVASQSLTSFLLEYDKMMHKLGRDRKNNEAIFNQMDDKINHEIHMQKHMRHQFQKSYPLKEENLNSELNKNTYLLQQQFMSNRDNLLKNQSNHRKLVICGLKDTEKILESLSSIISKSLQNERFNVSKKYNQINQMQSAQNSISANLKNMYQEVLKKQNGNTWNCMNKILYLNECKAKEIEKINDLKSIYREKMIEMNDEIILFNEKYQQEYEKSKNNFQKLINDKNERNNFIYSQKVEEKMKVINENINSYKQEINKRIEQIKNRNSSIINEQIKSSKLSQISENEEIKNHEIEITKLKGRLQFLNQSIEQSRQVKEKTLLQIGQEISMYDKKIRKFQRSIKTSIQDIDQEYEMKIQVLQIDLNNKIENLSKLFSKEENDRGCKIIEYIRKIKENENQSLNMTLLINREKDQMINEFKKIKNEKNAIINKFTNCENEKLLINKIDSLKEQLNSLTATGSDLIEKEKNQIMSKITNSKFEISQKLKMIENEIQIENENFKEKCIQFENNKNSILEKFKIELNQKSSEFNQKIENIKSNHLKEVNMLKKRIEFTKKIQQEELNKYKNQANEMKEKCQNELRMVINSQNLNDIIFNTNSIFENRFIGILNYYSNIYKLFLLNVDELQSVKNRRLRLEFQSVHKTEELSKEFLTHYQKVSNLSKDDFLNQQKTDNKKISFSFTDNVVILDENKDENLNEVKNRPFKKVTKNSKCNHKFITESHSAKKMPTLVTPRLFV